jgi:hypothetical protein
VPTDPSPPFPFARTVCACRRCSICCEHLPGALAPNDLPVIAAHLNYPDTDAFARDRLLTSDGATIATRDGRVISLPTLVPKSNPDGSCIFYKDKRCAIHAISPFGCAYIDAHMPDAEFTRRSHAHYAALLADQESRGLYSRTVSVLRAMGQTATPLVTRRANLTVAMQREGLL